MSRFPRAHASWSAYEQIPSIRGQRRPRRCREVVRFYGEMQRLICVLVHTRCGGAGVEAMCVC
jgi:hypothetical protein